MSEGEITTIWEMGDEWIELPIDGEQTLCRVVAYTSAPDEKSIILNVQSPSGKSYRVQLDKD